MPAQKEMLAKGRFLQLCRDGRWEYVQRVNASGAVHVFAVTPSDELLLVEQLRVPVAQKTIELPAGIVGDADGARGETPEEAAGRELVEETGYRPGEVVRLCDGVSAPGLCSEVTTLVHARNLQQVGAGGGVGSEQIAIHRVPLDGARSWLKQRRADGWMIDYKVYAALYLMGSC